MFDFLPKKLCNARMPEYAYVLVIVPFLFFTISSLLRLRSLLYEKIAASDPVKKSLLVLLRTLVLLYVRSP